MFVGCEGERDSIRLRVPGGDGGRQCRWPRTLTFRQEFGDTSINILSANSLKPIVFDLAASTAGGRQCVSMCCDRVLKVLGVKRVAGPQNPSA